MKRRALAALPPLFAWAALRGGLGEIPHAAALAGGLCAAAALLAAGAPAAAPPAWLSAAAALGAAALARLSGQWCADPARGFALAAGACAAGVALESAAPAPAGETSSLGWAGAAGLLAAALPAVLLFLGLNAAEPLRLIDPLAGATLFLLVQPGLLVAATAAALSRAARGLSRPAGAADLAAAPIAAVLGAALLAIAAASHALAGAGAALALAAAWRARPWSPASPPSARLLAAAAAAAVLLAVPRSEPLREIWTARLDAVYPGGRFLLVADDGATTCAAYEFSRGEHVLLREGVVQPDDATPELLALHALIGQSSGTVPSLLLARASGPHVLRAAHDFGGRVAFEDASEAAGACLDAVGGGPAWHWDTPSLLPGMAAQAALLFLPRPLGASALRGLASGRALRALRARLAANASAAVLIPPRAATRASVDAVRTAAQEAFGHARAAWLPDGGAVVVASPQLLITDPMTLYERMPANLKQGETDGVKILSAGLNWESEPPAK